MRDSCQRFSGVQAPPPITKKTPTIGLRDAGGSQGVRPPPLSPPVPSSRAVRRRQCAGGSPAYPVGEARSAPRRDEEHARWPPLALAVYLDDPVVGPLSAAQPDRQWSDRARGGTASRGTGARGCRALTEEICSA